jgi:CheY-like chemotaxis protein
VASVDKSNGHRRIVVADDNRDFAEGMALLLRDLGHDARAVCDSAQVLPVTREMGADLVLLDIAMPKLDGWQLCRRLRHEYHDRIRIVAITANGQKDARRHSAQAGFDAHIEKPVDQALLVSILVEMSPR